MATPSERQAGRAKLIDEVTLYNQIVELDNQYVAGTPTLTDDEYDRFIRDTVHLANHTLTIDDSDENKREAKKALRIVRNDTSPSFRELPNIQHMLRFPSIKSYRRKRDVRAWFTKYIGGKRNVTFWIEPKYDGIALSLQYKDGILMHAVTRGNAVAGKDILNKLRNNPTIPQRLKANFTGEVRGELIIPITRFMAMKHDYAVANARNLLALMLNRKSITEVNIADFKPYGSVCSVYGQMQYIKFLPANIIDEFHSQCRYTYTDKQFIDNLENFFKSDTGIRTKREGFISSVDNHLNYDHDGIIITPVQLITRGPAAGDNKIIGPTIAIKPPLDSEGGCFITYVKLCNYRTGLSWSDNHYKVEIAPILHKKKLITEAIVDTRKSSSMIQNIPNQIRIGTFVEVHIVGDEAEVIRVIDKAYTEPISQKELLSLRMREAIITGHKYKMKEWWDFRLNPRACIYPGYEHFDEFVEYARTTPNLQIIADLQIDVDFRPGSYLGLILNQLIVDLRQLSNLDSLIQLVQSKLRVPGLTELVRPNLTFGQLKKFDESIKENEYWKVVDGIDFKKWLDLLDEFDRYYRFHECNKGVLYEYFNAIENLRDGLHPSTGIQGAILEPWTPLPPVQRPIVNPNNTSTPLPTNPLGRSEAGDLYDIMDEQKAFNDLESLKESN